MERIYHTWDEWECYPAGFYENKPVDKTMTEDDCISAYREIMTDYDKFHAALWRVINEWKNSCEHYLTNERMNRIAWLGQAAMCIERGIPSKYRSGYMKLSDEEKLQADLTALEALNEWLKRRGEQELTLAEAGSKTQMDLY